LPISPCSCRKRRPSTTTATRRAFVELLESLLRDEAENDGFNRLVLLAGLDGRQIGILRAYSRYLRQAGLPFSQAYVQRCLATHFQITRALVEFFEALFSPGQTMLAPGSSSMKSARPCCRSAILMMIALFLPCRR
jgi:NAD-specific glutamate dehydrogenase